MKSLLKTLLLLPSLLIFIPMSAQTASAITPLETPSLDENSGLIVYKNKIITFNDSGGEPELYEIDSLTGNILRTVVLSNATNIDWEDIAQDSAYIYVGDIGNNYGNREDLKIYKISKNEFDNGNDTVLTQTISFSYADQLNFSPNFNNTNWDAEALITYKNQLLIFTKNWMNKQTNVYAIPKTTGHHTANLVSNYDVNGLITGADVSPDEEFIYLTGYNITEAPFIYTIHHIPANTLDLFTGKVSNKISNIVPFGNQIEGIAFRQISSNTSNLYISNERLVRTSITDTLILPAQLWTIEIVTESLKTTENILKNEIFVYPNPTNNLLKISETIEEIYVMDHLGRTVLKVSEINEISIAELHKGTYFIQLKLNNYTYIRKVVKN